MYLAQVNVAEILYPVSDPRFLKFSAGAKVINKKIENAKGFICGDQIYDNDVMFITRSVWESPEDLVSFIYSGTHKKFMEMSGTWFKKLPVATTALWYVDEPKLPSVAESLKVLSQLRESGESDEIMGIKWLATFA